ncbi:hypothetical protein BsWGS_29060 [Bradybaena similaris]
MDGLKKYGQDQSRRGSANLETDKRCQDNKPLTSLHWGTISYSEGTGDFKKNPMKVSIVTYSLSSLQLLGIYEQSSRSELKEEISALNKSQKHGLPGVHSINTCSQGNTVQ